MKCFVFADHASSHFHGTKSTLSTVYSYSASQIPFLWNPKVNQHVHKCLPDDHLFFCQLIQVCITTTWFSTVLILSTLVCIDRSPMWQNIICILHFIKAHKWEILSKHTNFESQQLLQMLLWSWNIIHVWILIQVWTLLSLSLCLPPFLCPSLWIE